MRLIYMYYLCCLMLILAGMSELPAQAPSFLTQQLKYERVDEAYAQKKRVIKRLCYSKGVSYPPSNIFMLAIKQEKLLEIWAEQDDKYVLLKSYPIRTSSGVLGPKNKQGDLQVPEGWYYIDRFNPKSRFHLSLGINYPNHVDLMRTKAEDPGGDIFIHGNEQTVGCLPMTDELIKEIYCLAVLATDQGQEQIPVLILPYRFGNRIVEKLIGHAKVPASLASFWQELEALYVYFEQHRRLPQVELSEEGHYLQIE